MATNVEIKFKIDGLETYIDDLETLDSVLKQVKDSTEKASKETDELADATGDVGKDAKKSGGLLTSMGKLGKSAFTAIKGAIAATGIGLLLTGLAQLVEWFKESDTGAKILQGTTAALGVIFDKIVELVTPLGEKIKALFTNPKQALIDFGNAIKDNLISRFEGILNFIPSISKAIGELFKGNFKEAGKIAFDAVAQVATGVEGASDKIAEFAEDAVEVFNEVADKIQVAVKASNNLIDAQNRLRKTQQDLLVDNAKLNQELETQKKISEDTTRSYDERKEALDKVNEANEQLADNAVKLAQAELGVLNQQLALAKTDEERREIKDSLAEAEAALIDAETQAQIVRLESAQLNRELDQEEVDRKTAISDTIKQLNAENIQDEEQAALKGIEIAEEQAIRELELLQATEEEIEAVREAFRVQREQKEDEYRKKREEKDKDDAEKEKDLAKEVQLAKLQVASQGLDAIAALQAAFGSQNEKDAKKNFRIQKALSLASATIKGTEAVLNAYNTAQASPITIGFPAYPAIQAGLAGAFAAAQIASIARSKYGDGGAPDTNVPTTGVNPSNALPQLNTQQGQQITPGGVQSQTGDRSEPIRAYVISTEVDSALQANQQIENLSRL